MKILIIKPYWIGEIINVLPAVNALRKHFSVAEISWLVDESFASLIELTPDVDEAIVCKDNVLNSLTSYKKIWKLGKRLKERKFDLVFDFHGSTASALLTKLSKVPEVIGFNKSLFSMLYTKKITVPNATHITNINNTLVREYLNDPNLTCEQPEIRQFDDYQKRAAKLLTSQASNKHIIAISPESHWASKCCSSSFLSELIDKIYSHHPDILFVIIGTQENKRIGDEICLLCRKTSPINLMGQTNLGTMVEIIRQVTTIISCDNGPMHVAALLKKSIFTLFGATDYKLSAPENEECNIYKPDKECSPCGKQKCDEVENKRCVSQYHQETLINDISKLIKNLELNKNETT